MASLVVRVVVNIAELFSCFDSLINGSSQILHTRRKVKIIANSWKVQQQVGFKLTPVLDAIFVSCGIPLTQKAWLQSARDWELTLLFYVVKCVQLWRCSRFSSCFFLSGSLVVKRCAIDLKSMGRSMSPNGSPKRQVVVVQVLRENLQTRMNLNQRKNKISVREHKMTRSSTGEQIKWRLSRVGCLVWEQTNPSCRWTEKRRREESECIHFMQMYMKSAMQSLKYLSIVQAMWQR